MSKADVDVAFFREGLVCYPAALATVTYFQQCVEDAIGRAFKLKSAWKHFHPIRAKHGLTMQSERGDRLIRRQLAGRLPDRTGDAKAWLSLGLLWSPPHAESRPPVVAYASCWLDTVNTSVLFSPRMVNDPVRLGPLEKPDRNRMYLVAGDDFQLESSFGLLLDAADSALATLDESASA